MAKDWSITVHGIPKGILYRKRGRWHWYRNNGATQGYPRDMTKEDVRASIARDCLAKPEDVFITAV